MTLIGNAAVFGREHEAGFETVQFLAPMLLIVYDLTGIDPCSACPSLVALAIKRVVAVDEGVRQASPPTPSFTPSFPLLHLHLNVDRIDHLFSFAKLLQHHFSPII
jgi:hypothetical protein